MILLVQVFWHWCTDTNQAPNSKQISSVFHFCHLFSVPGPSPGTHIPLVWCFLGVLWSLRRSQGRIFSLAFMTLTLLKSPGQLFCRISLIWSCLMFPYDWTQMIGLWHAKKVKLYPYYIISGSELCWYVLVSWLKCCLLLFVTDITNILFQLVVFDFFL